MWQKIKEGLGKFVQNLKNIFIKKPKQESLVGKSVTLRNGEFFINGTSLGTIESVERIEQERPPYKTFTWEKEPIVLEGGFTEYGLDVLKKLSSSDESFLPKRYFVPKLILSVYPNREYDSIGVDISQLEETGVAHFFCTSTKNYLGVERGLSILIPNATLIELGEGIWDWEE